MSEHSANYDLIVIGGGPAGMMAAGRAAERGARVLLLEKNKQLGRKLLLTGQGRCNLTNAESDPRAFAAFYGSSGRFLLPAFYRFGSAETVAFFEERGLPLKTERGRRVFPASDQARQVLDCLIGYLRRHRVKVLLDCAVRDIIFARQKIAQLVTADGRIFSAALYALTTGGAAYPGTGSTGDGYLWLARMGHRIIAPAPALAPVLVRESWVRELEGLSLKNITVGLYFRNKKIAERFGEALFTDRGLSGPVILDLSKNIGALLQQGQTELRLDFKPALDWQTLDLRLRRDFHSFGNRQFKNSLGLLLPRRLIPLLIRLSGIDGEKKVNLVTRTERRRLLFLLKNFSLRPLAVAGFAKAIITAGGADLNQIDPRSLRSKIIANLALAGEIIDLDGPTGGFNLQLCWSTGFMLGEHCPIQGVSGRALSRAPANTK